MLLPQYFNRWKALYGFFKGKQKNVGHLQFVWEKYKHKSENLLLTIFELNICEVITILWQTNKKIMILKHKLI